MSIKRIDIVGFGPGSYEGMTLEAIKSIKECDLVVGFSTYVEILKEIFPEKEYLKTGMGQEVDRVRLAFEKANEGLFVCLVCSGDSSLYGMAGLAYELSVEYENVEVNTVSGVTAALSGSALLGAACGNDVCLISLSDYHTSKEDIVKRLKAVAESDFVIALYNPVSKKRPDYLENACETLLSVLPKDRICGVARNIGRNGQEAFVMTLEELKDFEADMFCTVFIGNSKTININGKMVTPRGYRIG